jgi:hypothetical protein
MTRIFAFLLLSLCSIAVAQTPQLKSGASVYIEPMDGYETYLAAAIAKKKVPLIVVADKSKAEYIVRSSVSHQTPGQSAVVVNSTNINNNDIKDSNVNNGGSGAFADGAQRAEARRAARGSTSASISVIDAHSSQIVFAYSVGKSANTNQVQSTAEACAKHLKEFIEKAQKGETR